MKRLQKAQETRKVEIVYQDMGGCHQNENYDDPNHYFHDLLFVINFLFHFISPLIRFWNQPTCWYQAP
jgi:hypothetical protein